MLYVDVPTLSEFKSLHAHREEACVSIYLETTPLSQQWEASRIALGNLMKTAAAQLAEKGIDKNVIAGMTEKIESLQEDFEFGGCRRIACGIVTHLNPNLRLPNKLVETVQVSDRFHLKPLLRSITFRNAALCWRCPKTCASG